MAAYPLSGRTLMTLTSARRQDDTQRFYRQSRHPSAARLLAAVSQACRSTGMQRHRHAVPQACSVTGMQIHRHAASQACSVTGTSTTSFPFHLENSIKSKSIFSIDALNYLLQRQGFERTQNKIRALF
eukprot:1138710-Pelagomonas_calceolata.AAC.3